ncbi:MAG: hypothetical protein WCG55_03365 [bacterium]
MKRTISYGLLAAFIAMGCTKQASPEPTENLQDLQRFGGYNLTTDSTDWVKTGSYYLLEREFPVDVAIAVAQADSFRISGYIIDSTIWPMPYPLGKKSVKNVIFNPPHGYFLTCGNEDGTLPSSNPGKITYFVDVYVYKKKV